jgi:glutathione S-transferase
VIKIWGRNTSANVQKVMWAVGEIGLPHERIDIGGPFGGNREPAYLAKNPNGLVPTLEEDDGFVLWESNAIVRYLAAKHRAGMRRPCRSRTATRPPVEVACRHVLSPSKLNAVALRGCAQADGFGRRVLQSGAPHVRSRSGVAPL